MVQGSHLHGSDGCVLYDLRAHPSGYYTGIAKMLETLQIHVHDDSCFDAEDNIVCGYADFIVHEHEAICYDDAVNLRCKLEEMKAHTHDDSCYAGYESLV